jgi:gliding motility-associated-like protein
MRIAIYFKIFLCQFFLFWQVFFGGQHLFAQSVPKIPNSPIDFPPAYECVFIPDFVNNFSIREAARTEAVTIDLVMPLVGDVTGDGFPEILIPAKQENIGGDDDGYGRPYITSRTKDILVFRMGIDGAGNEVLNQIGRIITPYYSIEAPAQFVLAKVDGGRPLIIVAASWDPDNGADASRLVAFQYNGAGFSRKWTSDQRYGRNVPWSSKELVIEALNPGILQRYKFASGAAPAVADFNADGTPEVYVYNEIFNAVTGQFIVDGGMLKDPSDTTRYMGQGISQISPGPTDQLYAGTTAVSVAADLNNNGNLELAAGNTIYYVDIVGKTMTPVFAPNIGGQYMRDGFTSIADIDKDGQLDVVVTTSRDGLLPNSRQLYVWTLPSGTGPIRTNNGTLRLIQDETGAPNDVAISLAFIGDVNGDKNPNIGFNTPFRLWMLSYNPGTNSFFGTWNASGYIGTNDQSGHTYITMFDFDQNGRQDLVYRDETNLRIIDGITGANQSAFTSYSATANEGAIVADVDLDGEAEIIVTDRQRPLGVDPLDRTAAMVVYKSLSKPWAPARKVWNQYAYFSFNVNQDLTIPRPQPNHGKKSGFYFPKYNAFGCLEADELPFNNFLVQTTLYNDAGCQTTGINLMDAEIEILASRFICPSPDQSIEFELTISNASDAIGDATAAIPTDTPISFYVDGVFIGQYTLGDFGIAPVMPGDQVTFTTTILSSVLDPLVSSSTNLQAIINWDHAAQDIVYQECIYDNTSDLPLISRPIYSINSPSPLCYEDNSGLINSFQITPTNTVNGSVESSQLQWFLNNPTGTPLTNNGTYTIDPIDFSLSITGLNPGTYTFYLVDGCTDLVVSTDVEVYPLPAATFTTTDAGCFDQNSGRILVDNHLSGYVYYVSGTIFNGVSFGSTRFDSESGLESFGFKAGNYTIRTVNENGTNCESVSQVSIGQPSAIALTSILESNPVCEPSNGSISWSISGGFPDSSFPFYTYVLTNTTTGEVFNNPPVSDFGGGKVGISNLVGGQYSLVVRDSQGCEVIQSFTLTIQEDPKFDFPKDVTICEGEDLVSQVTIINPGVPVANPNYIWGTYTGGNFSPLSNGQGVAGGTIEISADGATATFKGLAPNLNGHEFAVRIENACNQPDSPFLVKVNPAPKVDISSKNITCFNGNDGEIQLTKSALADASEVYEYILTETGETNTTGFFDGLPFQATPYTILVRNKDTQCSEYFTVTLDQPEQVLISNLTIKESTCGLENGEIEGDVSGGVGPYQIVLFLDGTPLDTLSSSDKFNFVGLISGNYSVQAFDQSDCSGDLVDAIISNDDKASITIVLDDLESCEGELVTIVPEIDTQGFPRTVSWFKDFEKTQAITAGPDPSDPSIIYSLNGENLEISGLKSGTNISYYLEVTGNDFCAIEPEKVSVIITPPLDLELVYDKEICFGDGVTVTANATGGNDQFEFSLDGGAFQTSNIFDNVSSGDHIILIQTSQGCSLSQSFTVVGPSSPLEITNDPVIISSSCDLSNGEISNIQVNGGYGNYTIEWRFKDLNAAPFILDVLEVKDLAPGTYFLTIIDEGGCEITESFEVTELPDPKVSITEEEICDGETITLIPIQTVSGAAPTELTWYLDAAASLPITDGPDSNDPNISYSISNSAELTVSGLPAGDYIYYLKIECTGEIIEAKAKVNGLPAPVFEVTNVSCFGESSGKLKITSGGDTNYTYTINGGNKLSQAQLEALNLPAGTYNILIAHSQTGCFSEQELVIAEPQEPITIQPDVIVQRSSCGLSNGSITNIVIQGGWGNYQVEWRKGSPTGTLLNSGTAEGIEDLAPGLYFLIVTDQEGCSEVFDFEITQQKDPLYSPVAISDICEGESIVLEAINTISDAASTSFIWSKGPNKTNPVSEGIDPSIPSVSYQITEVNTTLGLQIIGLPAGNYTYYLFIACTGQEIKYEFEVKSAPNPVFQKEDISCFGANNGKIKISSGGGSDYVYSINGGTPINQNTLEATRFSPGVYDILVSNAIGCTSQLVSIEILQPEILEIVDVTFKNSACGSGDGYLDITWAGGTPWFTVSLLESGKIIDTKTSTNRNIRFSNLVPGNYSVQITDASNCQVSTSGSLTIVDGPSEVIAGDLAICQGDIAEISPGVNPSNTNASFSWYWNSVSPSNLLVDGSTKGGVTISIDANGTIRLTGLAGGITQVLYVTVSGQGICSGDEKRVEVKVDSSPVVTYTKQDELCFGDGGKIQFSSPNVNQLEFSLNGGGFAKYSNGLISGLAPGSYTIVVRNTTGCTIQLPNTIVISGPSGKLEFSEFQVNSSSCNSKDGEIRGILIGGTSPYSIRLLDGAGTLLNSQTLTNAGNFAFTSLGTGNYQVEIRDANQCVLLKDAIALNDEPTTLTAQDVTICKGEVATLMASFSQSISNVVYEWYYDKDLTRKVPINGSPDQLGATYNSSSSNSLQISSLPARSTPYSYFVMVSGPGVCPPLPKEVKVTVSPLPTLRVSNPSIVCNPNETVDLTKFIEGFNTNVFDYRIVSPAGTPLRLDQISAVNLNGSYTVQAAFKGNGCFTPVERIAVVIATTELVAGFDYQIELPGTPPITNSDVQVLEDVKFLDTSVGNAVIWNWNFGDGITSTQKNPTHQYQKKGRFVVTLTTIDSFGCISETQRVIEVFDDYLIMIPDAFTPDGNKNNFFLPKSRGIASMEFYVFSTWGELIFETKSLESRGWDGTFRGKPAQNGNYVYKAVFTTRTGEKVEKAGVFVLIR